MGRFACRASMLAGGWIALLTTMVLGQDPAPSSTTGPAPDRLVALSLQMAERVRELGEAVATDLAKNPNGPNLLADTRELARSVEELHKALPGTTSPSRRRRLFGGIDASWHHLLRELGRAGVSTPGVDAATARVGEVDAAIHKVLGSGRSPVVYYGNQVSPAGMPEIQRLGHVLVDRAEALRAAVRAEMTGPIGSRLAEEATSLVRSVDAFHDGIDLNVSPDDLAGDGFAEIAAASGVVAADLAGIAGRVKVPGRVRASWQSYRTIETQLRLALKLPVPQADLSAVNASEPSIEEQLSTSALAERLVAQLDEFLIVFTPEARYVAEGGEFIADARRLRAAAANFREEIPRAIEVDQLANAYRDVEALWQRLARRTNRIAEVRGVPNLPMLEEIGQRITVIQRRLGIPGFSAVIDPLNGPM